MTKKEIKLISGGRISKKDFRATDIYRDAEEKILSYPGYDRKGFTYTAKS